ncbi:HalOD1 output domain-containing protein [Halorientalis pallida]|uniref:Halobacterial output domain-containing protein n=1 Tax=Halorientalis pallida TaxID=2479928 RepID=A0A498L765_9EURY|nr:HalOD1 output domain-containing protein [Halorientalis pallida]RXK51575.1 hypothetical protein EAF64_02800 [Halorientalis pallida]
MGATDEDGRDRDRIVDVSESDVVYRTRYVGRPSSAIIDALVTIEEVEPVDLPVMYQVIDMDALDHLYREPAAMQFPAELSFSLGKYRFFLCSDGSISVYEVSSESGAAEAARADGSSRPDGVPDDEQDPDET